MPVPPTSRTLSELASLAAQLKVLMDEFDEVIKEDAARSLSTDVRVAGFPLTDRLNAVIDQFRGRLIDKIETGRLQQAAIDELSKTQEEINNLRALSVAISLAQTREEVVKELLEMIREKILTFGGAALYQGTEEIGFNLAEQWDLTDVDRAEVDRQKTAGFLQWVIRSGASMAMPAEGRYPTAVYVPMKAGSHTTGILLLLTTHAADDFTQSDHDRISLLCSQAAVAMENARLVAQVVQMKQYNESILLSLTNGLAAVDTAGRVTTLNPAGMSILNLTLPDILGRPFSDIPHLSPFADVLSEVIRSGGAKRNIEIEITVEDKKQILGISTSAIQADDERVIGALGVFTDLTPIKVLEKQVRRSDRLAVVGQLAAGAAHEIRNPLSAIRGTIQLLNRKLAKIPEPDVFLTKTKSILEEVDRINRIVAGMMDLSKEGRLTLERVSINKILRDVGYIVEGNYKEAGVGLELNLDDTIPEVAVDSSEMKQVFLNLYQNALQAMAANGKLTVTSVAIPDADGRSTVEVRVADSGCGIDAKHLEKIFAPFFTTKTDGTGLGLSIVHRIVEEHKGRIRAESEIGKGTTFIVQLPPADSSAQGSVGDHG